MENKINLDHLNYFITRYQWIADGSWEKKCADAGITKEEYLATLVHHAAFVFGIETED